MGYMITSRVSHKRRLAQWRAVADTRDQRIIDAINAGITVTEIHRLTGVSRAHIYRLLRREQQQCQKTAV